MMEADRRARLGNQQRLPELAAAHSGTVDVFCAHDLAELAHRQRRCRRGSGRLR
jgi:hypothetical protein